MVLHNWVALDDGDTLLIVWIGCIESFIIFKRFLQYYMSHIDYCKMHIDLYQSSISIINKILYL